MFPASRLRLDPWRVRLTWVLALVSIVLVMRGRFFWSATCLAAATLLAVGPVRRLWKTRHRLRRLRFTREGRWFTGLTFGVGLAAINTGNNLLYLVLGMMLSLIVVSGILSELTLKRLQVDRELPRQLFAGRPYLTGVALQNHKRWLPSFSVQAEDQGPPGTPPKSTYFLKVPAGARQSASYRSEVPRRGLFRFVGFVLSTRFPFGFFVKSAEVPSTAELLVFPRILPVADLPDEAQRLVGDASRPRPGNGREHLSLRPYREGDDARDIHWKRTAREGRLVLREYEAEGGRRVVVFLNNRLPVPADDALANELEDCVELAASIVVHLAERGLKVELRTPDERVLVEESGAGLAPALRLLAILEFVVSGVHPVRAPISDDATWLLINHRRAERIADERAFSHVFELG